MKISWTIYFKKNMWLKRKLDGKFYSIHNW
jgi:hypothetical protein